MSGLSGQTKASARRAPARDGGELRVALSVAREVTADLRLLTLDHRHAATFPPIENMRAALKALREDLAEVRVLGQGGKVTDIHDKIQKEPLLAKAQKDRIFRVLAEVRESYLRIDGALGPVAPNKGYQIVNWKHTRAEIDQVLEAAKLAKLSPQAAEDAILASIFSDAVKTPQNFIVHNIDGAAAAVEVLSRYLDLGVAKNLERVQGIWRAAKEHQIGPPAFMATICRSLLAAKIGKAAAEAQADVLAAISAKIAHPFDKRHLVPDGSELAFTDSERALLVQLDVHDWTVPYEGSAHYGASRAVIDGDSLINYACPDGWAKIAALRGPDTQPFFEDKTVFDSLHSAKHSFDDALTVVSDPAKPLMQAGLERTRRAIRRVRDRMQDWFATQAPWLPFNADGTIAFWNSPLKYPSQGKLDKKEQLQFGFAKEIRERVVAFLREEQGNYE